MTASCSSFRPPSLPSSLPSSSNNSVTGPDAEDDNDNQEVMTRIATSGALSSTESKVIGDLVDDDSSGALDDSDDMRLSLDDEVDERRGLNILRKSLKSASFLDIDCNNSPVWSENEEENPQRTLSLKRPDDVEASKDFRANNSNSFADELRVRMSVANSRSISSFDGFDESSLVRITPLLVI